MELYYLLVFIVILARKVKRDGRLEPELCSVIKLLLIYSSRLDVDSTLDSLICLVAVLVIL